MKEHLIKVVFAILGILVLFMFWEVAAFMTPNLVPHIWEIIAAMKDIIWEQNTRLDFLKTLERTLLAFLIAVIVSVPIGLAIGTIKVLKSMFGGAVDFFRSLPAFVLLPLFLSFFDSGAGARIAVAVFGSGLVIIANTAFSTAHVNPLRIEVARVYGANRMFILFHVVARQIMPQVFDGMRLAISLSLVLTIVSEIMLGATYGLGTRVNDFLSGFELPKMYGFIVLIGLMGYIFNLVGRLISEKLTDYGKYL